MVVRSLVDLLLAAARLRLTGGSLYATLAVGTAFLPFFTTLAVITTTLAVRLAGGFGAA